VSRLSFVTETFALHDGADGVVRVNVIIGLTEQLWGTTARARLERTWRALH